MLKIQFLQDKLDRMYKMAKKGEKVAMIYLFTVMYADDIKKLNIVSSDIVSGTSLSASYSAEISKALRLSYYVKVSEKTETSIQYEHHTVETLGKILNYMYFNADKNDNTMAIRLFGIRYAKNILNDKLSVSKIVDIANIQKSYVVEISKGINLSQYVIFKKEADINLDFANVLDNIKKPISVTRFQKLQETGIMAEQYFIDNYNKIDIFKGGDIEDARLFGDGYDFQVSLTKNIYLAEVKGIQENSGLFRLTNNEYNRAIEYKNDYIVTLVLNLKSKPRFLTIDNPIKNLIFEKRVYKQKETTEYHLKSKIS